MKEQQPEALRLADWLLDHVGHLNHAEAAAELRRLHELSESEGRWASEYLARALKAKALNAQLLEALQIEETIYLHEKMPVPEYISAAIEQAMYGKGQRHGGAATPFLDQPWVHYARMHGRGFLTGQAAKKLEEAASTREGDAFVTEVLGAMVYLGMAVLKERGQA